MGNLSNLKCQKAAPKAKPYTLPDGGGLYLWITPAGGKLWRYQYRFAGQSKLMTFGKFPDVALARVRLLHAAARAALADGVDPMAQRQKIKQAEAAAAPSKPPADDAMTFRQLADKWVTHWAADKEQRYVAQMRHRLEANVFPALGDRHPEEIRRADIVKLIDEISKGGARDIARRMLQTIRKIFAYAVTHGLLDEDHANPAAVDPKDVIPKAKGGTRHHASLEIRDVPELLRKQATFPGAETDRLAMELIAVTVLRTSEMIGGRWDEIDWTACRWTVPAERMKMNSKHIVPLSTQAIALLERLHEISGDGELMFPGRRSKPTISTNSILTALAKIGYKGRMTGHGWRSIFSTYLREQGFSRDHVEAQLAHQSGNEVERAYNYAEYLAPRTELMQFWADALDSMRVGEPVRRAA